MKTCKNLFQKLTLKMKEKANCTAPFMPPKYRKNIVLCGDPATGWSMPSLPFEVLYIVLFLATKNSDTRFFFTQPESSIGIELVFLKLQEEKF